ncbi:trypsin-like peptidase domain-containing protein [Clostridium sp. WLY-B-L2]|uniref:Trypsin-like peptidase domain-containing protein n=2 Tax=Clostridiaceae TaxID=31979 RepID=A0ABS8N1V6_9CLOT|nr:MULTISPECIES: trypsin-like peptidase domain-containing protein [Clostridium]MCC9293781.1 trypsin-like peptidase domain-containing protein [Clostridium aromativorans]
MNILSRFKNKFSQKHSRGKKIFSYISLALISSLIGASLSAAAFLYVVPNTDFFKNTPLYETINSTQTKPSQTQVSPISTSSKSGLTIAEIAKKVSPAVVGVSTKSISQYSDMFGFSDGQSSEDDGMGSGIIINSDGYILTNYHVIQGAQSISVILSNKKTVSAKVVNYDENQDLAVIKVTTKTEMPAVAELGNSDNVQVGDSVVAIGNPLGKELLGSVTSGIISATKREITVGNTTQSFLQTDAAINPGNSGGALVNSLGQVIGVNSAKIGGNGVEGIGFAIPINTVASKLNGLLKPILKIGIACVDIDSSLSKKYNIPEGVYVKEIEKSSPAEKAGLEPEDIIQKFDGKSIKTVEEINKIKSTHKSGDTVSVVIYRDGSTKTLQLTLTE